MLVNLHVKNFAIIDEVDVDFGEHLNILTGETGAGKSILVGSIGIALGARVSPEIIGKRADYAMVELVFQIEKPETIEALREMDIRKTVRSSFRARLRLIEVSIKLTAKVYR